MAIYREFEIGTAKPSREERARVAHHMIDVASPDETFTAGEYARQARMALNEIGQRGKVPIVVGGTGLYLRALIDGLSPGPQRSVFVDQGRIGFERLDRVSCCVALVPERTSTGTGPLVAIAHR